MMRIAFLAGVPLAWAALLLFHPTGDTDEFFPVVSDNVAAWQTVHIGTMVFVPLMAGVLYVLVNGIHGTAARVSRVALAPFAVFYAAYEVLTGIGTGMLVNEVNALPAAQRATGEELVESYAGSALIANPGIFNVIGSAAWLVAAVAAGVALVRQGRAPVAVPVLLGLSAPLIAIHVTPFGPVGLVLFSVAVGLCLRRASAPLRTAPAPA